jgi:hypothetical protein
MSSRTVDNAMASPSAEAKTTLITLPLEILLNILTHLPPDNYLAVTQTHPFLQAFLSEHAAAVCNMHILSYFPSKILRSLQVKFVEGWLVPTAEWITEEEPVGASAAKIETRLSRPGPQTLIFLETYRFEILVRGVLTGTISRVEAFGGDLLDGNEGDGDGDNDFARMVRAYAVRPFLHRIARFVEEVYQSKCGCPGGSCRCEQRGRDRLHSLAEVDNGQKKGGLKGWNQRIVKNVKSIGKKFRGRGEKEDEVVEERVEKRNTRELLFGEIDGPGGISPNAGMAKGLLWYYKPFGAKEMERGGDWGEFVESKEAVESQKIEQRCEDPNVGSDRKESQIWAGLKRRKRIMQAKQILDFVFCFRRTKEQGFVSLD